MKYFNKKQDRRKIGFKIFLSFLLFFWAIASISAQNTGSNCIAIPFLSDSLIKINKTTGEETVIGSIGVEQVQAIALNPTADTIYAARPGQLGIITFDDTEFDALPQPFGTGNGTLGTIDFVQVEGLTIDLSSNTLYGSVKLPEPDDDILIKINPETGAYIPDAFGPGVDYLTISGPGVFSIIEDIAVNPVDGEMYGLAREELGNDVLININKQNGSSTVIGPAGINLLEGLGFDIKGNLYATPGFNTTLPPRFFKMDIQTGEAVTIGLLTLSVDYESCDCLYVNTSPSAEDDQYGTRIDQQLIVSAPGVLENDSDPDGDDISIVSFDSTTTGGGKVLLNDDGSFTYTPDEGFEGTDTFTYEISDEIDSTDIANVSIIVSDTVNTNPVAADDQFSTGIDQELNVDPPGVLANDGDPDGDDITIVRHDTTSVEGGTVVVTPDGGIDYTPPDGFEGEDEFDYVISDELGGTDTATVSISVIMDATNPTANDDLYTTDKNTVLNIDAPGVLANDHDPNGDVLSVVDYDQTGTDGGSIELNPDGSFVYTPATDSTGTDTFSYVVSDGNGNSDTALVHVNVIDPGTGGENSPPDAVDDEYTTDQDTELEVDDIEEGVLANDSDPDGDSIAVVEVIDGITAQGGRITINSDGTLNYVPRLGYVGTDTYEYTVCDDQDPMLCDSATIFFMVEELPLEIFNAFSPNGDGVNDTWVIQGITSYPENVVQIFNRWGNLIFEAEGYDNTAKVWNGESTEGIVYGDNEVPDGAYYYVINLGDGSGNLSGYVVVRR